MPTTRSSARGETTSSPVSTKNAAGSKRKADAASPSGKANKRGRGAKTQQTIEESLDKTEEAPESEQNDHKEQSNGNSSTNGHSEHTNSAKPEESESTNRTDAEQDKPTEQSVAQHEQTDSKAGADVEMTDEKSAEQPVQQDDEKDGKRENDVKMSGARPESSALDQVKAQENEPGKTTKASSPTTAKLQTDTRQEDKSESTDADMQPAATSDAIQEDEKREAAQPSNILEKGIIYFFTRGRVGTDDPNSVQDLARSYFVLRPLPAGAKLTEGSIQDGMNNRLLALPKKVWPKSGKDRFMVFVEKARTSMQTLKEEFFQGSEYATQTAGTRQTPPVTPIGEGVYAITTTGGGQGTTHLAYMLTIPSTLGEVQKDVGLAEKGSFVLSLKNPEAPGPAYAQLPEKPDWPTDFQQEFSGRGWMPVHPKHLEYVNAQLLLIGEDFDSSNNLEANPHDEKDPDKETPAEELKKLEEEDEHRIEALKGDDSIFADLGISSKDYPKVMTTW